MYSCHGDVQTRMTSSSIDFVSVNDASLRGGRFSSSEPFPGEAVYLRFGVGMPVRRGGGRVHNIVIIVTVLLRGRPCQSEAK